MKGTHVLGRKKKAYRSHPLAVFALLTVIVFLARKAFKKVKRTRQVKIAQSEPFPYLPSVSPRMGCDIEGLRFLAGALTAAQIRAATGKEAMDPIRVYAGLAHGATAAARVAYAMQHLESLGAFERKNLLIVSPTGRGYVHPIPAETAELICGGDVAIVCVQYHDDQTLRAIKKLDLAADSHRWMIQAALARAVNERSAELGSSVRVHVYGESLGAWASQEAFTKASDATIMGIASGLWSGTPYAAGATKLLPGRLEALTGVPTAHITDAAEMAAGARFALLTNADDPIAYFSGVSVLYRPAAWTRRLNRRWLPGVTFAKAILEVEAATRPKPGVREATGHDYRKSVPEVMARLWLGQDFDEAAHDLVETYLTGAEASRRARMAFLHSAVIERE